MRLFRVLYGLVLLAALLPAGLVVVLAGGAGTPPLAAAALAIGAAAATAAAVSWVVSRQFTDPIRALVRGALEIARGRFGREVALRTRRDELGDLAYTFNYMSRQLASYDGENRRLIAALEQGYLDTIRALAGAIDAKDPYTLGHSGRVSALSVSIGRELGLPEPQLRSLQYAGLLHDIGKIGVPEQVLRKTGRLEGDEITTMRAHPVMGAEIVKGVAFLAEAAGAIRHHHERWDGTGYPDRLAGEAIPLLARVVNAADTWDACTSERPYQRAFTNQEVVEIMARLRATQLDPAVHDALLRVLERRADPTSTPTPIPAASAIP